MKKLNINSIRIDGGTQSRVEINNETVSDYAEAVKVGIEFPPVVVFHDGADNWLADGFHRFHAHKHAGKASIAADILQGSVRDAILYSLAANGTHGLRRSNADKRKSVQTLLTDPAWSEWSDRKIADACGVTHPFVANLRRPAVVTVTTPEPVKPAPKVVTVKAPAAKSESPKSAKRELPVPQEPAHDEQIAEAQHTITELAQENEQLRDKLAVEADGQRVGQDADLRNHPRTARAGEDAGGRERGAEGVARHVPCGKPASQEVRHLLAQAGREGCEGRGVTTRELELRDYQEAILGKLREASSKATSPWCWSPRPAQARPKWRWRCWALRPTRATARR
jgi:ParB-like chromosome segregation protein Spo0J